MGVFELPAEMGIASAAELKQQLTVVLESGQRLELDAGAVGRVDACALQLLLSLVNEAKLRGLEIHWSNLSEEFKASAELLGLADSLKLA